MTKTGSEPKEASNLAGSQLEECVLRLTEAWCRLLIWTNKLAGLYLLENRVAFLLATVIFS